MLKKLGNLLLGLSNAFNIDLEEKEEHTEKRIALLIDAENVPLIKVKSMIQTASSYGNLIMKRAYGDWSVDALKHWKNTLNANSVQPIQQFAYTTRKNSTDSAMIIDAMDLLYTRKYDMFVLATGDSDFTRLASRFVEEQLYVLGIGHRFGSTSFKNACSKYICLDTLLDEVAIERATPEVIENPNALSKEEVLHLLLHVYRVTATPNGWSSLSSVGIHLKKHNPDFDPKTYGFSKLQYLIQDFPEDFEMNFIPSKSTNVSAVYFRPIHLFKRI